MTNPVQTHRKCTRCQTFKETEMFSKDSTRTDGIHPHCKDCRRSYGTPSRKEARKNQEVRTRDYETHKRYYQRNRTALIAKMPTRDPIYNKNSFLKSTYGITLAEYDKMLDDQKGVCAICGNHEKRKSRYGGICRLHVDHDHKTGKVRGLLCQQCNNGIGHFKENVVTMSMAINYLTKHK